MKLSTFPFLDPNLKFLEETHEYFYKNSKYISVTTWLKQMGPEFDADRISKQVSNNPNSEYYGMKPKDIIDIWNKTSLNGNKKHSKIESWLKGETDWCDEASFFINLGITPENTWSEVPLVSNSMFLAGTADIITFENNEYTIWDIKTSKKLGEDKLKKFSAQIMTYAVMLYEMSGKKIKVNSGHIISIPPKEKLSEGITGNFEKPKLIEIDDLIIPKLKRMINERKKIVLGYDSEDIFNIK